MDLRKAIQDEMDKRDISTYALVQKLKGKRPDGSDVPAGTVYQFMRGESAINSDDLGRICDVLSLELRRIRAAAAKDRKSRGD